MTTLPTLAVTGSTGGVGGLVALHLAEAGLAQRLLVRTLSKAPTISGATVVHADYADRPLSLAALEGVETLFMVSGTESEDRLKQHLTFVEAAATAGVRHVVYTSFVAAASDSTFTLGRDHFATEQAIRGSGMQFTFLRDNFYIDFMPHMVGEDGVIRGPAGDGRAALVARADVARVAAAVLRAPGSHAGRTYDLTGPESLSFDEVAVVLSAATGRDIRYLDETIGEAYDSRAVYQAPAWQVDAWVSTYTAIAAGDVAEVSGDVERVTGIPPISLREYLTLAGDR